MSGGEHGHALLELRLRASLNQLGAGPLSQTAGPWGGWGSNPRPTDYESGALTN